MKKSKRIQKMQKLTTMKKKEDDKKVVDNSGNNSNNTTEINNKNNTENIKKRQKLSCTLNFTEDKPLVDYYTPDNDAESTNVFVDSDNSTNAAGLVGLKNLSISKPPWNIKSCDQVIQIQAETLPNKKDYTQRTAGFFTLSMYMVNSFASRVSNALLESLNLENIYEPIQINGALGCLDFIDNIINRRLTICLPNEDLMANLKDAFFRLKRCRNGDNLKESDKGNIRLYGNCLGVKIKIPKRYGLRPDNKIDYVEATNKVRKIMFSALNYKEVYIL